MNPVSQCEKLPAALSGYVGVRGVIWPKTLIAFAQNRRSIVSVYQEDRTCQPRWARGHNIQIRRAM